VPGIQALGATSGLVVRNGNVTGFSGPAIIAGPQSKLLQLRIATNGGGGIVSAFDCLIEDSVISDNTLPPAIGAFGCKIENNVIEGNTGNAIQGDLNVIVHNRIFGNSGTGILSPGGRSMIAENAISQNGLDGVDCGPGCTIKGNTVINNGDTGVTVAGGGSNVVGNTMSFNATVGLLIDVLSAFSNNNMNGNAGAEKVPAAHPTDAFDNICGGAAC
jgi:parallel beta-helix repeat protein